MRGAASFASIRDLFGVQRHEGKTGIGAANWLVSVIKAGYRSLPAASIQWRPHTPKPYTKPIPHNQKIQKIETPKFVPACNSQDAVQELLAHLIGVESGPPSRV